MKKRILLLVVMALLALALFAPAALAQDDDDNGAVAPAQLADTGDPALLAPVAGALLLGAGAAGLAVARRREPRRLVAFSP